MAKFLTLKKSNCKNCYKCIRHCPVKSIRFSGNQAHIIDNECILCGRCFVSCPQNAKQIVDDTEKVKVMLQGDEPVIAFLDKEDAMQEFLEHVYGIVDYSVEKYLSRGFKNLMVSFGCTGGQHRSVYSAEHLASHLTEKFGVRVILTHREQGITQEFASHTVNK